MNFRKIIDEINIVKQCRKYNVPLWQCPQFLFLIMGIIIIFSILSIYFVGEYYIDDPLMMAFVILLISIVLFILAVIITKSFERLAEANRLKSEFVNIVSHQLRSPLSNIKWILELLISKKISTVSEKQMEYLVLLKENNDKMRELVSDLLMVSRIEENRIVLNQEKVALSDLIEESIKEMESFSRASNVKINFNFEKNLPLVLTDPYYFKMIINNFLDNSIRYVKKGGKIDITLKKNENNFYIEVKDDGVGIPKEDQKYIFKKFFRSANIRKHQTEGSGLDLYIVKSIVDKLKGKIGFSSQEDIGSTFWFTLPLK